MSISARWHRLVEDIWYGKHPARLLLAPLGWLFRGVAWLRRAVYASGLLSAYQAPVPVVVVGNITVGGTGKTPLVIWLAQRLREYGFKPGIVARGYRGVARSWPQQVRGDSDPVTVGDEAVVIARRTRMPVAVGPRRGEDIEQLLRHSDADIIVCDDGLQHYALKRDIEIVVLDGVRRVGNGACLPAGPLREPPGRLAEADLVVSNGLAGRGEFAMRYLAEQAVRLGNPRERRALDQFEPRNVHAVAGVGNPEGFFALLKRKGLRVTAHAYPDHHAFSPDDLDFGDGLPVLMTEKDAVKCEHFADQRMWYVPIDVELPEVFERRFKTLLKKVLDGQEAA
ncbi:MAG: tetraacyldisaccharide 4'-kinase [Gammaproteobacteria bacterium]|nr:tetraacyldisaccharide 4'-kinase [Gammaproteobacteria bacterium]